MSTPQAEAFSAVTVYLVVTVTVNRRQIAIRVILALLVPVLDFQPRLCREKESTVGAPPAFPFQQRRHPA